MPTIQRRKTTRRRKGPARPLLTAAGLALAVWGGLALLNSREAPPPAAEDSTGITLVIDGTAPVIPQVLLDLAERNPETQAFVEHYPGRGDGEIDISGDYVPGEIPHFLQWDQRWGYLPYGGDRPEDMIGLSGCGPTALAMVAVGLTGNLDYHPAAVAEYAAENGYATREDGTAWTLMSQGCAAFGLTAQEVPLWEQSIIDALAQGPIICAVGAGDFTDSGHFFVITAYENGAFRILDPNSISNSERTWTYAELSPQIQAMWVYSAAG